MDKYFIVYVTEDIFEPTNKIYYRKGDKIAVWYSKFSDCYWALNTIDIIPVSKTRKLYELKCVDILEDENE